jgi:hypothetical protein
MLSSGPFTMAPGDTQEVVVGLVIAQGTSARASVALMKCFDQSVQSAYNVNFNLPSPPNPPVVSPTPQDNAVLLTWDSGSLNYNQPPYKWEGFNVYQGASVAGPFTRIATYDLVNGITTVLDVECDPESPVPLQKVKAFGTDAGLQYSIRLTQDVVRGTPLHSATTYYYAVTAYSVGVGQFQQVLESPFNVTAVIPQSPPAGTDLSVAAAGQIVQGQVTPGPSPTTDQVSVNVIDPASMVKATWTIGYKPVTSDSSVWYLVRATGSSVDTVLNNQTNISGDQNYGIVDGVQVILRSKPAGQFIAFYADTAGGSPAALEGADRGLPLFGGGAGFAAGDLGGTIPDTSPVIRVEVRFTGGAPGQKAYRYLRTLDTGGNRVYAYQDYVDVPFYMYDVTNNRQVNAAFLENAGPPPSSNMNGQWDPNTDGDGGREILWALASPYSGATPDAFYTDPANSDLLAGTLDLYYELSTRKVSDAAAIDAGDKFIWGPSVPGTGNDQFTFTTTAPNAFNASLAKSELTRIRAVPNPYFAHSTYELNRFNRQLKFTHLPVQCTIRIFNLAGDLVRTIQKNDNTSQATWDLNTTNGLPIGSGIYLFHVEAPGAGTYIGKVAVFMEKERLNNF